VELRVSVLNSIYFILLHYPLDVNHFALKKAHLGWVEDIDNNKGTRDLGFENEVSYSIFHLFY